MLWAKVAPEIARGAVKTWVFASTIVSYLLRSLPTALLDHCSTAVLGHGALSVGFRGAGRS